MKGVTEEITQITEITQSVCPWRAAHPPFDTNWQRHNTSVYGRLSAVRVGQSKAFFLSLTSPRVSEDFSSPWSRFKKSKKRRHYKYPKIHFLKNPSGLQLLLLLSALWAESQHTNSKLTHATLCLFFFSNFVFACQLAVYTVYIYAHTFVPFCVKSWSKLSQKQKASKCAKLRLSPQCVKGSVHPNHRTVDYPQ